MDEKQMKKHKNIINNYDKIKSKHLEILATKMLENDKKSTDLKKYEIDKNIFKKLGF
jgi:uncharacterized tellurite resistance protein B-like protein